MPDWWMNDDQPRSPIPGELPPGVDAFEAPHPFLLHTLLVYHRTLISTGWHPRVLILRLARVPYLDARGARAVAMLSLLCRQRRTLLLLSDVRPEVWRGLGRQGVLDEIGPGNILTRWQAALDRAREFLGQDGTSGPV